VKPKVKAEEGPAVQGGRIGGVGERDAGFGAQQNGEYQIEPSPKIKHQQRGGKMRMGRIGWGTFHVF